MSSSAPRRTPRPPRLAIVIPAFKSAYLRQALESIAAQTCTDFRVYVGDDASPDDLRTICEDFASRIDLRYVRFDRNLGGPDLVAQWSRCVALSGEPWVWLFGDDDEMEPGCVEALLARIDADAGRFDLYHFDVVEIDGQGAVLREAPAFPDLLPALDFAQRRMAGRLSSYAPDYVFSRAAFDAAGGFQEFPLAWATDDATWIKLARRAGIRAVRGPRLRWRQSGENLSSDQPHLARRKLEAALRYVGWFERYLHAHPPRPSEPPRGDLLRASIEWLSVHRRQLGRFFWPASAWLAARELRRVVRFGVAGALLKTARWDWRLWRFGW